MTKPGAPPTFLHAGRVDINAALSATADFTRWYFACRGLPAPPFSGGTWDSWPAWAVDVWRIASQEEDALKTWALSEKESGDG